MAEQLARFTAPKGVLFIGKAQEKTKPRGRLGRAWPCREAGAELQEEGAEAAVYAVEVVVVSTCVSGSNRSTLEVLTMLRRIRLVKD